MADVTMRLIWYRLNELYNSTSAHLAGTDLAKIDILDLLFVGWCLFGILATIIVNFIYDFMHPKSPSRDQHREVGRGCDNERLSELLTTQSPLTRFNNGPLSVIGELLETKDSTPELTSAPKLLTEGSESCLWLNTLVAWLFLNKSGAPALLEAWLGALNYALAKEKRFDGRSLLFEDIIVSDEPPQIVSVRGTHGQDKHIMELLLEVRASQVKLRVRLSEKELCEVALSDISAKVSADLRLCPDGFKGSLRLLERPVLSSEVRLLSKSSGANDSAAYAWIAEEVTTAVSQAVTEIFLTDGERSGSPHQPASRSSAVSGCFEFGPSSGTATAAVSKRDTASQTASLPPLPSSAAAAAAVAAAATASAAIVASSPVAKVDAIANEAKVTPSYAPAAAAAASASVAVKEVSNNRSRAAQSNETPQSQPVCLLVKLIKATGLKPCVGSSGRPLNPFACVEMDEPNQRHVTGSVYGTSNPYWDQHFMLDLSKRSNRLSLHVFDRNGQADTLLGSASLLLADLPSQGARVIQPLRMPRRDSASTASIAAPPPTLTAEFLFMSASSAAAVVTATPQPSGHFSGPRAPSASSVLAESAVTVVQVSPASAHHSSGVGSSPKSDESAGGGGFADGATGKKAISEEVLEQRQQPVDGTNSSLSRTVDEFMKSTDVSYQPMSSTDSAASQPVTPAGEAQQQPPPVPQHSAYLTADTNEDASDPPAAPYSMTSATSTSDHPQTPLDYTQSLPVLNVIPGEDDGRGTTKSKGNKKASRSGSFASRFRRVFLGPDRKSTGRQQQQQQQPPPPHRSPSIDQVFSDEGYYTTGQRPSTSRAYSIEPAYSELTPSLQQQQQQQQLPPHVGASADEFGNGQRRNRSLSSSLRRLFTGGRKKKIRQRAESGPVPVPVLKTTSPLRSQRPAETRGLSGQPGSSYDTAGGQSTSSTVPKSSGGRAGGWNSEEIL